MSDDPFESIFLETSSFVGAPDGYVSVPLGLQDEVSAKQLAWAYGQASLTAIRNANKDAEVPQLAFPALFLARHAVELYLKGLLIFPALKPNGDRPKYGHKLMPIWRELQASLLHDHKPEVIARINIVVEALDRLDPASMAFRYKDGGPKEGLIGLDDKDGTQVCVNFARLQNALSWMFDCFDMQSAQQDIRGSIVAAMSIEAEALDSDFSTLLSELRRSDDPTKEDK